MTEPSAFRELVDIADGILALLACVLLLCAIPLAFALWRALRRAREEVTRLAQNDVSPLLRELRSTAQNLAAVSATVRQDIDAVHTTVTEVNHRARQLVRTAERRIAELDAVLRVAQEEAEDVLLGAVAAARGVRAGASVLGDILGGRAAAERPDQSRRPATAPSARESAPRGEETVTYDSGEFGNADEPWGESGNGGPRPRVRPRRHSH